MAAFIGQGCHGSQVCAFIPVCFVCLLVTCLAALVAGATLLSWGANYSVHLKLVSTAIYVEYLLLSFVRSLVCLPAVVLFHPVLLSGSLCSCFVPVQSFTFSLSLDFPDVSIQQSLPSPLQSPRCQGLLIQLRLTILIILSYFSVPCLK